MTQRQSADETVDDEDEVEMEVSMATGASIPSDYVKAVDAMRRNADGMPPSPPLNDRSFHRVNAMFLEDVIVKEKMTELGTENATEAYGHLIAEQINANPEINCSWKIVVGAAWAEREGTRSIQWEGDPETVAEITND